MTVIVSSKPHQFDGFPINALMRMINKLLSINLWCQNVLRSIL